MDSNKDKASGFQVWHTNSVPNSSTVKLVARSKKSIIGQSLIPHNLTISPHSVGFDDKVFAFVRQKLGRTKEDKMERVDTNALIWEYLWLRPWRQRYFSEKIISNIYVLRGTQNSLRFGFCSPSRRNWSLINRMKCLEWARSTWIQLLGWEVRCYMSMLSSGRQQDHAFFRIRCCALEEELQNIHNL